ncbi:MAG: CaiB/BaiF CoA-transferase family protein [Steroidobacteraceae bacterium]
MGPLAHIRVLDLSRVLAGPWSGQMLADLGADVIKVEKPGSGDDTRSWGPPFLKGRNEGERGDAAYYLTANRGKRSIAIDLASNEGQAIVRELARRSDIVIENFKAGTLARYGLDYASLKKVNDNLIYCSITGFGQDGPRRDQAAYDFMIQAMGGLMSVTGERDGMPGAGPQKVGVPIVDILTGMYASVAMLAALARRNETGEGEYIDLAMLDVTGAMMCNQGGNYLISGKPPVRTGNKHPNIQPQDVFACADGFLVLVVGNDGQYEKFCKVLGRPELAKDERFATNSARVKNQDALLPIVCEILKTRGMQEWADQLDAAGVPCGPINSIPQMFEEPQVKHRGTVQTVPHPTNGSVRLIANPIKFSNAKLELQRHPPLLGEHTEEVLREIGWTAN